MKARRKIPLSVRFDEELYNLVKRVAKARGEDVSDFVRRSVKMHLAKLNYLSEEEKKALLAP